MVNYPLIESCMVIPYNIIERQYPSDEEFILPVTFIVIIYLKDY